MPPRTQYAKHGDLNIAYQVTGDGPIDIVVVPSFVSNIEFWWAHPTMKAWWDRVTSFARLILFDKLGTGCSDPVSGPRTLEQRSDEIKAVMDAVGCERPVLFGLSEGGPSSIVFAATHPGQVQALVLFGTFASGSGLGGSPDEVRASLKRDSIAESYWPTDPQLERIASFQQKIFENWGDGEALALLVPNQGDAQQQAMAERLCASPGMARATMESATMIDIRDVLPTIDVPTLVVHADEDLVPIQAGRYIADHIPGARFLEVKTLDTFDFAAADGINATQVHTLARGEWVTAPENLILAGPIGTGKTHLAIALGVEATKQKRRVLFTRAADLVRQLLEARDARALTRLQQRLLRVDVLIVDELGFVPFDRVGGELLFNLLADRYERRATVVTSNLAFAEWVTVFAGDEKLTTALLDRLAHHATVLTTKGKSYRMRKRRPPEPNA